MSSTPWNMYMLGGGLICGIVCAAAMYLVDRQSDQRRRHAMSLDLARVDHQLATLRQELDQLLLKQKSQSTRTRVKRRGGTSIISSSTNTDYETACDANSSDLEFYDISDEDVTDDHSTLEMLLDEIDRKLDEGTASDLENCIERLENLCIEHPENPQLLWRIGKAHYKLHEANHTNQESSVSHLNKGIDACKSALKYTPPLAQAHKWLGFLIGSRCKYQPVKAKIQDGYLFKEHIDRAIELDPNDASLHYSLGLFCLELAELKWYERQMASTLFGEPPKATHEDAMGHFVKADSLGMVSKENKLAIAKCKIKLGNAYQGVEYLRQAQKLRSDKTDEVDLEIDELLKKYT